MRIQYAKSALLALSIFGLSQWSERGFAQTPEQLYQRGLAATCANCHGSNGKGVLDGGMPLINNLTSEEMLTQLTAFKTGTRTGTIMPQLAKGYSNEQLTTIANQLGNKN